MNQHYQKQRTVLGRLADQACSVLVRVAALSIILLMLLVIVQLVIQAFPAMAKFGLSFLISSDWNPTTDQYGVLPHIIGTVASAFLAMLIAVPIGLLTALFLNEPFLPSPVRKTLGFALELLAAIPSVVYGLWGIFVLVPLMQEPANWLHAKLSWFPLLSTPLAGPGLLPAAMVLALMVLPTIAALSRDALAAVPAELRLGGYALGATRWQTLLTVILPAARRGIAAAVMLALGRAIGETMAVAMLIGNSSSLSWSLLSPATTISAHLANQFGEASGLQLSALIYAAVVLLAITLLINGLAVRLMRSKN